MSRLTRYAAALYYIGPRQASRLLLQRIRRHARRYDRYARPTGSLEWVGQASTRFLRHSGGAELQDGRFTAVGVTRDVGDPPRWDSDGPLLWQYNLHYFSFLHALPRDGQLHLVRDWIDRYKPSSGLAGWAPYPISLRIRHWTRWLLEGEWPAAERVPVLDSIEAQARCLADGLELHLRGNHILENAITLKMLAACFRGPFTHRWGERADDLLRRELPEQFLTDGGHFERSPTYHALLARGLLDLVNVLPASDPLREHLLDRLPAILQFTATLRHPDGEIALFNDAAFGIAPPPQEVLDYAARLGLETPSEETKAFPATGYYVWRRGGDGIMVDAGPIGPDYLPGHGHGDIFSFELSLDGRRIVVDGGTSTYERGAERDWVRSTRAHNTVEVAGSDQCEFFAAFRVGRRGRPRDVTTRVSDEGLHVAGWHDGYRRLPGRPIHHRELTFLRPGGLVVWDTVESGRPLTAVSRLRFPPGARIRTAGPLAFSIEIEGHEFVLRTFGGDASLEEGHYSPRFGERLPCSILALRKGGAPEFGYVLARRDLPTQITAGDAIVGGRRVVRRARRPGLSTMVDAP